MLLELGPDAGRLESEHFVVVYTSRPERAGELTSRLEAVYAAHLRFMDELGLAAGRPEHKLEVCLFASYGEYRAHLERLGPAAPDLLGGYDSRANRCMFFDLDTYPPLQAIRAAVQQAGPQQRETLRARLQRRETLLALSVIQHEAAHQVQFSLGLLPSPDRVPPWLVEGLATLFEVPFKPSGECRQPLNGYRLYEFRKLYGGGTDALGELRSLLTDDQAWCGGKCYPLAWAVTRFLRYEHPAGLAALLRQVRSEPGLLADPDARGALFDRLFGPIDRAWIDRLYARTMELPLDATDFAE
jgi:hypothetical protein